MEEVSVAVGAKLVSPEQARSDAQDLAWEHTLFIAEVMNIDKASDAFADMFKAMGAKYSHCVDYLEFFTFTSLLLLRTLYNDGDIAFTFDTPITDDEFADELGRISQTIVSSYAWLFASEEFMWPSNEDMPDDSAVTFTLPSDQIIITES